MTKTPNSPSDRSVHIGSSVSGSVIQTGDQNTASIQFQQASLPQPKTVDIGLEITALKTLLSQLASPDKRKIENALEDAEDELQKLEPDKDEVGQALDRALKYAERANGFAEAMDKLRPHVEKAAGWLGKNLVQAFSCCGIDNLSAD
ncbi:MAG: hypothetical protein AAFY20_01580 [Cyanobacteria bacterium J06639_14]